MFQCIILSWNKFFLHFEGFRCWNNIIKINVYHKGTIFIPTLNMKNLGNCCCCVFFHCYKIGMGVLKNISIWHKIIQLKLINHNVKYRTHNLPYCAFLGLWQSITKLNVRIKKEWILGPNNDIKLNRWTSNHHIYYAYVFSYNSIFWHKICSHGLWELLT